MKAKIFQNKLLSLMIIFVLGLVACNSGETKEKEPEKVAEEKNEAKFNETGEKDATALAEAFSTSMFEKELSDSIRTITTNKKIKGLADSMVMAHNKINDQIKELAVKKSITLPASLSSDQYEKINKLVDKKQSELGEDYVEELIDRHKNAISMYEKKAAECTDPDIKAWFEKSIPTLRQHLDMITLYDKEKMAKK